MAALLVFVSISVSVSVLISGMESELDLGLGLGLGFPVSKKFVTQLYKIVKRDMENNGPLGERVSYQTGSD